MFSDLFLFGDTTKIFVSQPAQNLLHKHDQGPKNAVVFFPPLISYTRNTESERIERITDLTYLSRKQSFSEQDLTKCHYFDAVFDSNGLLSAGRNFEVSHTNTLCPRTSEILEKAYRQVKTSKSPRKNGLLGETSNSQSESLRLQNNPEQLSLLSCRHIGYTHILQFPILNF